MRTSSEVIHIHSSRAWSVTPPVCFPHSMTPTSSLSTSSSTSGGLHHFSLCGDQYPSLGHTGAMKSTKKHGSSTSTVGGYSTTTESRTRLDGDCLSNDRERLQKLGYDPVLGRSLTFWSNMFLTLTNMSPVYDMVASITVWGHNGPLLFVSIDL